MKSMTDHKHVRYTLTFVANRYLNRHSYNAAEKNSKTVTVHQQEYSRMPLYKYDDIHFEIGFDMFLTM